MSGLSRKKPDVTPEALINTIWVSTFLAMIFALPPLGLFLGIYFWTGELVVGAIVGFGVHFLTLAFSERISKAIIKIMR